MKSIDPTKDRLEHKLLEAVNETRPQVMDVVEQELGHDPKWLFIRARLLNSFGEKGLVKKIRQILDSEFSENEAAV